MSILNKALIKKINKEYSGDNNQFNLDYVADDIMWNIIGQTIIAGKENFINAMKKEELEKAPVIKIENIIAEGEYVVIESNVKIKNQSGKSYKASYCDIYHLKNGKINKLTTYKVDATNINLKKEKELKLNKEKFSRNNGEEVLRNFDETIAKLLQVLTAFKPSEINKIPFEGSWTAGELARHLIKSASGFAQILNGPAKESERNSDEKVERIKSDFLDFRVKTVSADVVAPESILYEKEILLRDLEHFKEEIRQVIQTKDLSDICLTFEFPVYGYLTRLESVYFVIYHTQRHTNQLKNIFLKISKDRKLERAES